MNWIRRHIIAPILMPLDRFLHLCAEAVEKLGIYRTLQVLGIVSSVLLVAGLINYFNEDDARKIARQTQAWSALAAARDENFNWPENRPPKDHICPVSNLGLRIPLEALVYDDASLERLRLPASYLRGANLEGAKLRKAYLNCSLLDDSNLQEADLHEAELELADLACTSLRGANLVGAKLWNANLRGTDLRKAELDSADLERARLRAADLRDADLTDADLTETVFDHADLRGAKLGSVRHLKTSQIANACIDETTQLPTSWTEEQKLELLRITSCDTAAYLVDDSCPLPEANGWWPFQLLRHRSYNYGVVGFD